MNVTPTALTTATAARARSERGSQLINAHGLLADRSSAALVARDIGLITSAWKIDRAREASA